MRGSVLEKLPFLSDLKVRVVYPDTVVLTPIEEKPLFYFVADIPENEYVVVSENQKVLEMFDEEGDLLEAFPNVYRVDMPPLRYIVSGQPLQFANRGDGDYIPALLKDLDGSDFAKQVVSVDVKNRFEIMVYGRKDGQFDDRISLGNKKDLHEKLLFASGIRERIPEDFVGLIGVEDPVNGYADPDDK